VTNERVSALVDVSQLSITDTAAYHASPLTASLRAIIATLDEAASSISGWSSFIDREKDEEEV
jgi:hypothetical protein